MIDGKAVAQAIEKRLANEISTFSGRKPGLAFILVGENPGSQAYIRMKKKKCQEIGIASFDVELPESASEKELLAQIAIFNTDAAVDGILVQLPLPAHISTHHILEAIAPNKDVDGFHPLNVGKMLLGETDGFFPCTPWGIITLLTELKIPVEGKHVVIVGRSNIVGKPLAALLMQKAPHRNATVTVAHSQTTNLSEICRSADILIAAIGKPRFIRKEMVKPGAVVIDVGINRLADKIVGDVAYDEVAPIASHITPVPGGVGPMTIAILLSNTVLSYKKYFAL